MVRFKFAFDVYCAISEICGFAFLRVEENALIIPNMFGLLLGDGGVNQETGDEIQLLALGW